MLAATGKSDITFSFLIHKVRTLSASTVWGTTLHSRRHLRSLSCVCLAQAAFVQLIFWVLLMMFSKPKGTDSLVATCRVRGCHYFGADFFDGYCSLCYRIVPEGAGPYYSSSAGRYLRQDLPFVGTMASSSGDAPVPRLISHRTHPTDVSHLEAGDWWVSIEPSRLPEHDLDWRCLVCDKVAHRLHVESKMHRKRLSMCQPQWDLSVSLTRGLGAECRRAWLGRIKSQIDSQKDHCGMLEQNNCLVQLRLRLQDQGFWLPPPPGLELVEVLSE